MFFNKPLTLVPKVRDFFASKKTLLSVQKELCSGAEPFDVRAKAVDAGAETVDLLKSGLEPNGVLP